MYRWHSRIGDELKTIGITHPQFVALTALSHLAQSDEYVTQVNVANMADMDVMSVSQIVRRLEANGFLHRRHDPRDSRANIVQLLGKGQKAVESALPIVEDIDQQFFGELGENEATFRGFFHKLS